MADQSERDAERILQLVADGLLDVSEAAAALEAKGLASTLSSLSTQAASAPDVRAPQRPSAAKRKKKRASGAFRGAGTDTVCVLCGSGAAYAAFPPTRPRAIGRFRAAAFLAPRARKHAAKARRPPLARRSGRTRARTSLLPPQTALTPESAAARHRVRDDTVHAPGRRWPETRRPLPRAPPITRPRRIAPRN